MPFQWLDIIASIMLMLCMRDIVYVSRLPSDFKATDLAELGAPFGQLAAVRVLPAKDHYHRDRDGNPIVTRATGCIGFLLYTTHEAARIAVDALDGVVPRRDAEPMSVKWAKNCMGNVLYDIMNAP